MCLEFYISIPTYWRSVIIYQRKNKTKRVHFSTHVAILIDGHWLCHNCADRRLKRRIKSKRINKSDVIERSSSTFETVSVSRLAITSRFSVLSRLDCKFIQRFRRDEQLLRHNRSGNVYKDEFCCIFLISHAKKFSFKYISTILRLWLDKKWRYLENGSTDYHENWYLQVF